MNLLRALSRFIAGTSYSKKCSSTERIEGWRETPIGRESVSGTRSRQFAFDGQCVSDVFRERKAALHLIWNHASAKRPAGRSRRFGQRHDHWRRRLEQRVTIIVSICARSSV